MVSIIIPAYNRAAYLKEAIRSVLDQDYLENRYPGEDFELLVVDDGSTDNTRDVVSAFSDILHYYPTEHRGVSAARNTGLSAAKGEFIAFLDSDDLWKKEKLSSQMSLMRTLACTRICYTEEVWIRNGVFVNPKKKHRKYSGWIFDKVLPLCLLSLSSAVFRTEVFDEVGVFDEDLPACEDYDLGIRIAHRYPIHLITRPLIIKRGGHPGQLSHKYWGMDRFRIRALEKALALDLSRGQEKSVMEEIICKCRVLVQGFEKRKKKDEQRKYLSLMNYYQQKLKKEDP